MSCDVACMYVHVCIYVCLVKTNCPPTLFATVSICIYVCLYLFTCMYIYVCMYVCMYVQIYASIYVQWSTLGVNQRIVKRNGGGMLYHNFAATLSGNRSFKSKFSWKLV